MLMSSVSLLISLRLDIAKEVTKHFLFVISLLGATIQDSGKKERSDVGRIDQSPRSALALRVINC